MLLSIMLLSGCALNQPSFSETEPLPETTSVVIEPVTPASTGSLWTQQRGSLFYDTKGRNVGDIVTVAIYEVEVYPNGNLRITGAKTVTVNSEKQIVKLTGIVRPSDISAQNVVDSQNILDARIAYTGKGVVSDKQQQGWLMRVVDNVWPF
ncbi:MAG: flagellar basal body L-ring protein FlgH [Desulfuromonadaceae bacterium]